MERALRQSSQNRIALITGLLKMLVIAHRLRTRLSFSAIVECV